MTKPIPLNKIVFRWANGRGIAIQDLASDEGEPLATQLPIDGFYAASRPLPGAEGPTRLNYKVDPSGFYEPIILLENSEYIIGVDLQLSTKSALSELQASQQAKRSWPFANPRLRPMWKVLPADMWRSPNGTNGTTVFGKLSTRSYVGRVDLALDSETSLWVEVASAKIGYLDDFRALLTGIADDLIALLYDVDSASGYRLGLGEPVEPDPAPLLFHLRRLMQPKALPPAVELILGRPHVRLLRSVSLVPAALATSVDVGFLAARAGELDYKPGGPLRRLFRGLTPTALPETRKIETVDTPENRFVKAFLEGLELRMIDLENILKRDRRVHSLGELKAWRAQVAEWLSRPMWRDVGGAVRVPSSSQVLLRRGGYREILEADLTLRYSLSLPWARAAQLAEGTVGDIRPIYELYEYWCYFTLRKAIRAICGPELPSSTTVSVSNQTCSVNLRKGRASRLNFSYKLARVSLFYNRTFDKRTEESPNWEGGYSSAFHPDFSVLVQGGRRKHWLHFDAKYRLDLASWREQVEQPNLENLETELAGVGAEQDESADTYKRADLYKVHTYRDAVLGTRGAYVMFPGSGTAEAIFVRHALATYRRAERVPSVGAFPISPELDLTQAAVLAEFLRIVLQRLTRPEARYQEEEGIS